MTFGMTYDEFYFGTPRLVEIYRDKYNLDRDRMSFDLWLAGYYNFIAVSTALSNAFKDKGKKADEYIKDPIHIRPKTQKELQAEMERKQQELINKLNSFHNNWVIRHKGDD